MILRSLLVGAFFRPPAKQILSVLPAGNPLALVPEPSNAYDPEALAVMLLVSNLTESSLKALSYILDGTGVTMEDVLAGQEFCWDIGAPEAAIHVGYVASEGNKQLLAKGPTFTGNATWLIHLNDLARQFGDDWAWKSLARFAVTGDGKTAVEVDLGGVS